MDAASRIGLLLWVLFASVFSCNSVFAQEALEPDPIAATNPFRSFAQWVGRWMAKPPSISVRFAIHDATNRDSQEVAPCSHKMCAGGKCYEVETGVIEGTPCDASGMDQTVQPLDSEPIIETPAAPPLPPSYQFTRQFPQGRENSYYHAALDSMGSSQVSIPASVLVALLVDHARHETELAMTRELLEERTAFLEQLREMSDRNMQLESKLAISQLYLDYHAAATTSEIPAPSSLDVRSIQEDLSNIRKQIALLKRNQPVPFAPSYVGSDGTIENAWSHPWRSSRRPPYAPIAPQRDSQAQACQDSQTIVK